VVNAGCSLKSIENAQVRMHFAASMGESVVRLRLGKGQVNERYLRLKWQSHYGGTVSGSLQEGKESGESAGARTQDQRLKRAMLYQLSYALEPLSVYPNAAHYAVGRSGGGMLVQNSSANRTLYASTSSFTRYGVSARTISPA
jgi:hypothetical protein